MPKVRLIKFIGGYCDNCDASLTYDEFSKWEEVTDEELATLKSWQAHGILRRDGVQLVVWEDITNRPVLNGYIHSITEFIAKENKIREAQAEREKALAAKKKKAREERALVRAQKLLKDKGLL
jgi:hypothetical protein